MKNKSPEALAAVRTKPMIQPILLGRGLGIGLHAVKNAMQALGIDACRPTPNARGLLTIEEAERLAQYLRDPG
jgi:hypothetical protein